jgi:hypothetical protein
MLKPLVLPQEPNAVVFYANKDVFCLMTTAGPLQAQTRLAEEISARRASRFVGWCMRGGNVAENSTAAILKIVNGLATEAAVCRSPAVKAVSGGDDTGAGGRPLEVLEVVHVRRLLGLKTGDLRRRGEDQLWAISFQQRNIIWDDDDAGRIIGGFESEDDAKRATGAWRLLRPH